VHNREIVIVSTFADHAHVGANTKDEVLSLEPGHFGQAQPGLYGDQQKGVVTPAGPGTLIRRGKQGVDFGARQEVDQSAGETLAGDSKHPLDLC
jgi:hypothetical protein